MLNVRRARPLDIAIWVVVAAVLAVGAYLAFAVWQQNRNVVRSTPAARGVAELAALVKKQPNNIGLRMDLAQALVVAQQENSAVDQYRAILKVKKDYPPALSGLGFVAMKKKDWATGEGYFRRVVDLLSKTQTAEQDSGLETAYFYLGTALMEQKKYVDAVGYFKAALRLRRDASDTHYALAYTYKQLDSPKKYRDELEAAIAFDPTMPEANYDLGLLMLQEGDLGRAAELFRMSANGAPGVDKPQVELDKLGPFKARMRTATDLEKKDPKKALEEARIAVALEPKDLDALRLLAVLWEANKDKDAAAGTYRRILTVAPGDAEATKAIERLTNAN